LYAEDGVNQKSASYSLPIYISQGAITTVSGIFLSPTITVDKNAVYHGETITVMGQSSPNSKVVITVNSDTATNIDVQANSGGWYSYMLNTTPLELGDHQARSRSFYSNMISPYSSDVLFKVVNKGEPLPVVPSSSSSMGFFRPGGSSSGGSCNVIADINKDCKVNLVDFSILAYWYKRPNPPAKVDLNNDKKINLADFSIMAYYWKT
jgi:hypothetical protein